MSRLSASTVYQALVSAGLSDQQAQTLTAIGGAESNLDVSAIGDVNLENSKWGPSIGVFQIRTLKAETGTGSDRDIKHLQGNLPAQVAAALHISSGGRDFSPWSTYTNGTYRKYLPGGSAVNAGWWDKAKGLPGDIAGGAVDAVTAPLVEGFKGIAFTAAFAGLGLVLVGAGVVVTFGPQIKGAAKTAVKVLV